MVITNTATSADRIGRIPTAGLLAADAGDAKEEEEEMARTEGPPRISEMIAVTKGAGGAKLAQSAPALPSPECAA
jgi:hypothetical protein